MITPTIIVQAIQEAGFTHVVWIPDSHLGLWETELSQALPLVRVCREGEAVALAAGLILGLKKPLVIMQCTGFFEAGDAVRNVVHDMQLPLKMIVGVRSLRAKAAGKSKDNCPDFAEPLMKTWGLPYRNYDPFTQQDTLADEEKMAGRFCHLRNSTLGGITS